MPTVKRNFERLCRSIAQHPDLEVISAVELQRRYGWHKPSLRLEDVTRYSDRLIATRKDTPLAYMGEIPLDDWFGPAEIVGALTDLILAWSAERRLPGELPRRNVLGPIEVPLICPDVTLRDGSVLYIHLGLRGLSEIQPMLADLLAPSGFLDLDIVYRLLAQTTDDGSVQRHFLGFRNERLVSFLKYDASARVAYICSLGYVFTAEDVRGLGIAENLCRAAITDFKSLGGRAAFLSGGGTGARVYQRVGFRAFYGHIMRWIADDDEPAFEQFHFAGRPVAMIRNLSWADWAMAAVLYGQPTAIHIRDYGAQLYSGEGQDIVRFQSVIPPLMRAQEAGTGCTKVAEDTLGHLVGIATLRVRGEGRALVDFLVHPTAQTSAPSLLAELALAARTMRLSRITMKVARADEAKLKVCEAVGARIIGESVENTGAERMEPVVEMRLGKSLRKVTRWARRRSGMLKMKGR